MYRFVTSAAAATIVLSTWATASATATDGVAANTPQFARSATVAGPVAPTQRMRLVVHLAYPDSARVEAFAKTVNNPASPMFGNYLTPAQFTAAFAPSHAAYSGVVATLRSAGFQILATYPNRKVIDVSGDVAHAQAFFNTVIYNYYKDGSRYYGNAVPARIPDALRGVVMAVAGFNSYDRVLPRITPRALGSQPFGRAGTKPSPYSPVDIETAYNEPIHVNPKIDGSAGTNLHATIAIETAFDYQDTDLQGFWKSYSITRSSTAYVYRKFVDNPSGQGIFNPAESTETTADIEWSSSVAPGANVLVIEGVNNLTSTFDDVYANTVNDPRVDVVTTSWGLCENAEDPNEVFSDNDLFMQGAAEGQTMFAASGDNGSKDCTDSAGNHTIIGVDFPSSSPWVGASGGTTLTLNSDSTIQSETGWSGSGGGVSTMFALPEYQTKVPTLRSRSGRNVPDFALNADVNTGYGFFYLGASLLKIGGTSLVAPNMAAAYAQFDGYYNKRLGLAQNGLYLTIANRTYPGKAFHDILTGSNGDFTAHQGYDNVTGVGSLNAYIYMKGVVPHAGHTPL
jgi:kumamolisin